MSSKKLVKKGSAGRDKEGSLLLVNEENHAYRVDETVAAVWERCEGRTVDELTGDVAASTGEQPDQLKEPIENLVSKLKEAKLVA